MFSLWRPACSRWRKPVLDLRGTQVCAETAIVRLLLEDEWEAVWVSSNRYRRDFPPQSCSLSAEAEAELRKVRGTSLTGCWDVFAFKSGTVLFVECKRKKRDSIKLSQREWLSSALKVGFKVDDFLIIEWTVEENVVCVALNEAPSESPDDR